MKVLTTSGYIDEHSNWNIVGAKSNCRDCNGTGYQGRKISPPDQGMKILCHCIKKFQITEKQEAGGR